MKRLIIALTFSLLAGCGTSSSANFAEEDYKMMSEANNQFAFDLFNELLKIKEAENIFFSPTSVHLALALAYNGAKTETKQEMGAVLHVNQYEVEETNRAYASFLNKMNSDDGYATVNIANSIWIRNGYPFLESFLNTTEDYYGAEVHSVDFMDPKTKDEINEWVEDATNKKIKDMVQQIKPNTVSYLLNAIYFKGEWKTPFDEKQTYIDTFTLANKQTKPHPFMSQYGKFDYLETNGFQAISLPYANDEMSMIVVLPREGKSLKEFYSQLTAAQWDSWLNDFSKKEGSLQLPKFEMEFEATLNDPLINLGMPLAFSGQADFRAMVEGGGIAIDEVRHKSYIVVNEKGTEAAAATSIAMTESAAMDTFTMTVNRPFFYAIVDNASGTILFLGEMDNPVYVE
ncbi:serpin family protein [Caldibacillus lycopersici]|uniref:Serpin family protein n=1 Tax=Perspicuibacillus lycopersici TaxID=1325689 RepID=A0AAE3LP27_9BACI|nr:serpin family protein [Perspicuibacillus lycopersici]MCU9614487.1 serpin family protein [Perspicuibacillus lycopersici]